MKILIILLAAIIGTSCSTLNGRHSFYVQRDENTDIHPKCEVPGNYGDSVEIEFEKNKVTVSIEYDGKTNFGGPPFLPLIPDFWNKQNNEFIYVNISYSDQINIDSAKYKINLNDSESWVSAREKDLVRYKNKVIIDYGLNSNVPPNKVSFEISDIAIDGKIQESRKINFVRKRKWKFTPFILPGMDSRPLKWDSLPCD